uniref:Uncharacterized protein n=1 Tax=Strigamia maritima TaxID=126957 RepID=T1JPG2_STRMM
MTVKTLLNIFSDDQLYAVLENVYEEIQRDFSCGQTVDHLRTLREIIEVINEKQSVPDLRLLNALKYIISDICTPILILEHVGKDEKLRNVVIDTKLFCLELTGEEENVVQWADECEKIVRKHFECVEEGSDPPEKCLKPEVALEIIKFLLKKIETDGKSDFNQFFLQFQSTLSLILSRCDSQFASSLLVDIVPMFFQVMDPENKVNFARVLWKRVESFFTFTYFDCQSRNTSNGYVIMCNLMELITDGDEKSIFASLCDQILSEKNFWLLIRFGLAHENSLHRKQSLYVLKLVTSRDRLESQHFSWSNYVLIIETLEETQVHVIKPVLGKIDQVIKASDVSTFYFDLMTTIFHRMFMHDSKFIKKWALERFLHLDLTREKFIDTQ